MENKIVPPHVFTSLRRLYLTGSAVKNEKTKKRLAARLRTNKKGTPQVCLSMSLQYLGTVPETIQTNDKRTNNFLQLPARGGGGGSVPGTVLLITSELEFLICAAPISRDGTPLWIAQAGLHHRRRRLPSSQPTPGVQHILRNFWTPNSRS